MVWKGRLGTDVKWMQGHTHTDIKPALNNHWKIIRKLAERGRHRLWGRPETKPAFCRSTKPAVNWKIKRSVWPLRNPLTYTLTHPCQPHTPACTKKTQRCPPSWHLSHTLYGCVRISFVPWLTIVQAWQHFICLTLTLAICRPLKFWFLLPPRSLRSQVREVREARPFRPPLA